jgi:hypothetical protein
MASPSSSTSKRFWICPSTPDGDHEFAGILHRPPVFRGPSENFKEGRD